MTTGVDPGAALRRSLADRLAADGRLHSDGWRAAVEAVPREVFLGDAVYRMDADTDTWSVLRRSEIGEPGWLDLVYRDETWVTQVGGVDAVDAFDRVAGAPTSSSSLPGLVVGMLEDLDVRDGQDLLEIGTGTGYSTALMCHRAGAGQVTSVEVDPGTAARARTALAALGYEPDLRVGDGFGGAGGRDHDRIIATCAFRYVPPPWLYQVDTGAKILVTLSGWLHANAQVLLDVDDEGTASGRFLPGFRSFMMARSHQPPPRGPVFFPSGAPERDTPVGLDVLDDWTGVFVAQLAAPSAVRYGMGSEGGLLDVSTGSQARVRVSEGGGWRVAQHGPVRLWDAVEEAVAVWRDAGSPHASAFGLTAAPGGQRVWLETPDGPSWRLPV
ncbi:ATP-grasp peptide maturase system methyltransferase [Actinorugispora endophytica]|uniref:Protein-L-isoaspartate O-methyltransferase n=1 Tax=Actinorugispora endophytica TaxID=1605990 RepID=A0A4R6V757_9ACTN|nr:ATP-grasp peptide maturase system methyltransferase [Actinorugispora endophytica]TDQ55052.1 methyltransferase of ATP-grasp peptide maturase system [Actinorugispora endophytica]